MQNKKTLKDYDNRIDELKQLLIIENSMNAIAAKMHISRQNVAALIRHHGLSFDRNVKRQELIAKVKELAKTKSQAAIARQLKMSQSTVCNFINYDETRVDTRAYKPKLLKKEPPMNFAADDLTKQLEAEYRRV